MKSRQINCYLTLDDIVEIEKYLKEKNLEILATPSRAKNISIINNLNTIDDNFLSLKKHIILNNQKQLVMSHYIENQNYYLIDVTKNPVIEFWQPYFNASQKILRRGRLYYVKEYYDQEGLICEKNPEFLKMADDFFKWFRKNFKQQKIEGYQGLHVTKRANDFMKQGGKLPLNN